MGASNCEIVIQPGRFCRWLTAILILLFVFHVAGYVAQAWGVEANHPLIRLFDLNKEVSFPTFFTSLAFILSSFLLAVMGIVERANRSLSRHWFVLAGIFLFLAVDESLGLTKQWCAFIAWPGDWDRVVLLRHPWVFPYSLLAALVAVFYWRFFCELPELTRTYFILAGSLFILGEVVLESLIGFLAESSRWRSWKIIITLSELLENGGILVFIYALTAHIRSRVTTFRVRVGAN